MPLWKNYLFLQSLNHQTLVTEDVQALKPQRLQTGESFQITPTRRREGNYISLHQHAPGSESHHRFYDRHLGRSAARLLSNQTSDQFSRLRRQSPGISADSTTESGVDKAVWSGFSSPTPALRHDLPCLHCGLITSACGRHAGS